MEAPTHSFHRFPIVGNIVSSVTAIVILEHIYLFLYWLLIRLQIKRNDGILKMQKLLQKQPLKVFLRQGKTEIFLSGHFVKYSFNTVSGAFHETWNAFMKYFCFSI